MDAEKTVKGGQAQYLYVTSLSDALATKEPLEKWLGESFLLPF